MIKATVAIFLLVQALFTALDLRVLYRAGGMASVGAAIRRHGATIAFFLAFWLVFFAVQTGGVLLLPTFDRLANGMAEIAGADLRQTSDVSWTIFGGVLALTFWTFALVSFFDYASHRFVLHHFLGWRFHEYHHLPRMIFNGMPGISVRPFVFFATFLTYLGVAPILVATLKYLAPTDVTVAFLNTLPISIALLTLVLSVGHSLYLRRFPFVHRVLRPLGVTSPQEHLLHHSSRLHCNYGNFSTVWDRWFGTYVDPLATDIEAEPLGVPYAADFLSTLTFGLAKLPPSLTRKIDAKRFFRPFDS